MTLFEFIKILFKKSPEYDKISQNEKAKFFFMLNRFMSINYPVQANMFNHVKISQSDSVDYWHEQMCKLYTSMPGWMMTKVNKGKSKEKIEWPSDEAVKYYLERMQLSKKDLQNAVTLLGDQALDPIRRIDANLKENI